MSEVADAELGCSARAFVRVWAYEKLNLKIFERKWSHFGSNMKLMSLFLCSLQDIS